MAGINLEKVNMAQFFMGGKQDTTVNDIEVKSVKSTSSKEKRRRTSKKRRTSENQKWNKWKKGDPIASIQRSPPRCSLRVIQSQIPQEHPSHETTTFSGNEENHQDEQNLVLSSVSGITDHHSKNYGGPSKSTNIYGPILPPTSPSVTSDNSFPSKTNQGWWHGESGLDGQRSRTESPSSFSTYSHEAFETGRSDLDYTIRDIRSNSRKCTSPKIATRYYDTELSYKYLSPQPYSDYEQFFADKFTSPKHRHYYSDTLQSQTELRNDQRNETAHHREYYVDRRYFGDAEISPPSKNDNFLKSKRCHNLGVEKDSNRMKSIVNHDQATQVEDSFTFLDGIDARSSKLHDFMFTLFEKRMKNIWPQPVSKYFCRICNYKEFTNQIVLRLHLLSASHERYKARYDQSFCLFCQMHCLNEEGMSNHAVTEIHVKNKRLMETTQKEGILFWHATQSHYFLQNLKAENKQQKAVQCSILKPNESSERCTQTSCRDFKAASGTMATLDELRRDIFDRAQMFYELSGRVSSEPA